MDARTVADRLGHLQLLDVREDAEWEAGHIEGAVHIPGDELADRLDQLDRSRPVVTVCRTGTRSDAAAEWLRRHGFEAESLESGLLGWKWAGMPVTGPITSPGTPPDDQSPEMGLHDELIAVGQALQERFGDREPTEEELHEFLRARLISEGRTPEEAEEFLAHMGEE